MDTQLHSLPPLKRLSLLLKRDHQLRNATQCDVDFSLPAKKRAASRHVQAIDAPETTTFLLPTKKRVRPSEPDCCDFISSSKSINSKLPDQQVGEGCLNSAVSEDDGQFSLPAKERRDSRYISSAVNATFSLPNNKRVWAIQPDMFDLNIEYKPVLDEDCQLESKFGNVEISECKTSDLVEDQGNNDGFHFNENPVEAKIIEREERVECLDLEMVSNLLGVENTESKVSKEDGDLGRKNSFHLEENPVEVKSSEDTELVQGAYPEIAIKRCGGVVITESKIGEAVEELRNDEETNFELNQAVSIYEVKESVNGVELESSNYFDGGAGGCGRVLENVTSSKGVIDVNGERGDLENFKNFVEDDGANISSVANFNGIAGGDSESDNLRKVTNIDVGFEGDCESEDGVICEICQSTDGDPSDPIVFCDGCDLMVHASCYGNPLIKQIPEGDWFCDKCTFQAENPVKSISCCLCPSAEGGLKPTNDGRWAHIVCAVFVPEAFFVEPHGREGIEVSKICAKRWKKECYVCKKRKGCVVDCSEAKCCLSFHVTCGLKEDLCIEYREGNMKKGGIVAGFCKDHTALWKKQQQTGKFKIVAREEL